MRQLSCHFDHSLLNYNHNFITPQLSWFLNHALPPYFLPSPLVFLSSSLYFFRYHHQYHLFVSPLSSLWSFKFEKELHWNLGRRGGEACLVTPIDWGWSRFFSLSLFFLHVVLFHLPLFPPLFYSYFVITYAIYDFFSPIFGPILQYMHIFPFLHLDGIYWIQSKKKKNNKEKGKKWNEEEEKEWWRWNNCMII